MSTMLQDGRQPGRNPLEGQQLAPAVDGDSDPRTRLVDHRPARRDDEEILTVIRELPRSGSARSRVFTVGLLNEAGELYREVDLLGEYEALLFNARMNAHGFSRVEPQAPIKGRDYESIFTKR